MDECLFTYSSKISDAQHAPMFIWCSPNDVLLADQYSYAGSQFFSPAPLCITLLPVIVFKNVFIAACGAHPAKRYGPPICHYHLDDSNIPHPKKRGTGGVFIKDGSFCITQFPVNSIPSPTTDHQYKASQLAEHA